MVQALGINEDTSSVDNGSVLLIGEADFVGAEITIGATGLQLPNGRRVDIQLTVDTEDILANRQSGHAVGIVRDASQLGALAGEEGLPPWGATLPCVFRGPVDQVGSVLVRAHEENLILSVEIHNWILDTRADGGQEKIEDTVDVLLKGNTSLVLVVYIQENDTLGSTLRNVLVLALLGVGKVVVLIEHGASVDAVGLLVTALHDTDTSAGDVSEAEMESAELGADHKEHAIETLGVLMLRQEVGVESEAQGHLGRGEEVGLEDGGVENTEGGHDHFIVLVDCGARDELLQLLAVQDLVDLEAHVAQGGEEIILGRPAGLHIVGVGKIQIELVDELGVSVDDLEDVVGREGLGTQPLLDLGQQFSMNAVVGVEKGGQGGVFGAKAVEELLDKDPRAVSVDGLLQAKASGSKVPLEFILRDAVKEGDLLDDLVDGGLDGRVFGGDGGVDGGTKVEGDHSDAVREVLQVLPGAGQAIVVIQVGEGTEHAHGRALAIGDDQPLLPAALNLEHFDDGAGTGNGSGDDLLVDGLGVGSGLLQETLLADDVDVGLIRVRVGVAELALVHEVAPKLLFAVPGERGRGTEGLYTVTVAVGGAIDVFLIDPLLVARAIDGGETGPAGIDVDGMILGLLVEADLELLVVAGIGGDLGGVE